MLGGQDGVDKKCFRVGFDTRAVYWLARLKIRVTLGFPKPTLALKHRLLRNNFFTNFTDEGRGQKSLPTFDGGCGRKSAETFVPDPREYLDDR